MREGTSSTLPDSAIRYQPPRSSEAKEGSREWYLERLDDLLNGWQDMPDQELQPSDYERSKADEVGKARFDALSRNKRRMAWFTNVGNWVEMACQATGADSSNIPARAELLMRRIQDKNLSGLRTDDNDVAEGDGLLRDAIAVLRSAAEHEEAA